MKKLARILTRAFAVPAYCIAFLFASAEIGFMAAFCLIFVVFEWIISGDTSIAEEIMHFSTMTLPEKIFGFLERITSKK